MTESDNLPENERIPGRRFVRRMFMMRILGTLLCFFPILSVLQELQRPRWMLGLLAANAFLWPGIAFLRARHAPAPLITELQNLVMDAGAGGVWIASMAINPLPSVVIATILLSDRLSAGGFTLMRKAGLTMLIMFLLFWLALGLPVNLHVSERTLYATLPLIAIYILALSVLTNSMAAKLRLKSQELGRIAMMDPLLDIANRRLLEQRIQQELEKQRLTPRYASLMFIDIDNFKEVNDRFGHKVGDALLETVSRILHSTTRKTDTPARLGGDEFVILMPDTSSEQAHAVAMQIMNAVSAMSITPGKAFQCTLSIGIASVLPGMLIVSDWLKAADDALYQAKRRGKNQIYSH